MSRTLLTVCLMELQLSLLLNVDALNINMITVFIIMCLKNIQLQETCTYAGLLSGTANGMLEKLQTKSAWIKHRLTFTRALVP